MRNRDMYNSSGCLDMTFYLALRNIEREERLKKEQFALAKRKNDDGAKYVRKQKDKHFSV